MQLQSNIVCLYWKQQHNIIELFLRITVRDFIFLSYQKQIFGDIDLILYNNCT